MSKTNQSSSFRQNLLNLLIVPVFFCLVAGCFYSSDKNSESKNAAAPDNSVQANKPVSKTNDGKKTDDGDFLVEHLPIKNPRYNEIDQQIKKEKLLERAADKLNRSLMLPYNIALRTQDCGEPNAFYYARDHSIMVCYELMEQYYRQFKSVGMDDDKAYDKMFDAVRFAFLHELGHALIDAYKLPVLSNEEDAADRCSSYICLTELGDEGVRAVQAAADSFKIASRSAPSGNMADEHLLDEQRFYNTLCMIYGSDTNKYEYLVRDNYLPRQRAARCATDFERTVQSWNDLFKPWRKQ